MVGRAARPDVVASQHAWNAHDDALEIGVGDHDPIAQDPGRGARDLIARMANEPGDDESGQRVEDRQARSRAGERRNHRHRRPHVTARLHRVGKQHFAPQSLRFARFVPDDEQIHGDGRHHHHEAGGRDGVGRRTAQQMVERITQDFEHHECREADERARTIRLRIPSGSLTTTSPLMTSTLTGRRRKRELP